MMVAVLAIVGLVILGLFLIAMFGVFCLSLYFNYKHGMLILRMQDAVNESLDLLDESYTSLSKISEKEIFFDSPEIRMAVSEIRKSRDAVLYIAGSFANVLDTQNDEEGPDA